MIKNGEFEGRVDVALLFVATNVNVLVVFTPVSQLVNERGVTVKVEDDWLGGSEQRIEVPVWETVGMFSRRLQSEKINYIYESDFEIGKTVTKERDRCERFQGRDIASACHHNRHHCWPTPKCRFPSCNA